MDIQQASKHLEGLIEWLKEFQGNGFEKSLQKAKQKAEELGVDEDSGFNYRITRNTRPRRYRDEEENAQAPLNNLERFKSEFFESMMANMVEEFEKRFQAIRDLANEFDFLWGLKLSNNQSDEQVNDAKDLVLKYIQDLECVGFLKEMEYLNSAISPFLVEGKKLSDTTLRHPKYFDHQQTLALVYKYAYCFTYLSDPACNRRIKRTFIFEIKNNQKPSSINNGTG